MPTDVSQCRLLAHERLALLWIFLAVLLIAVAEYRRGQGAHNEPQVPQKIWVTVAGACKNSSHIELCSGSRVGDVVARIELADDAAIEKLPLTRSLQSNEIVLIPKKGCISVWVEGAVAVSGVVELRQGATFRDLEHQVILASNADQAWLRRHRRKLREGECITIPCIANDSPCVKRE